MGSRAISLLRLAALPPGDADRRALTAQFRSTGTPEVLLHKLDDFARRGFVTSADVEVTVLTALGRRQLARAEALEGA